MGFQQDPESPHAILGGPTSFMVFFIYSTEQTVRLNRAALKGPEEESWSYGQTLALVTALISICMPLLGKIIVMFRAWVLRSKVRAWILRAMAKLPGHKKGNNTSTETEASAASPHDSSACLKLRRCASAPSTMV
ncbi:hypothetical protein Moror_1349 [Moniliophthora roreri MCA 2997]|uniref:Uncharacterized protein n=1 Tax=Moniliophthora roreri (strain MCA 2997) TaxID=1381753 RepID=V2WMW1_MONRO|nr:hypothetical protein Moror_1349 [Moniliophthora roreri MCA 2997]